MMEQPQKIWIFILKKEGVSAYTKAFNELKNYFIKEKILFTNDVTPENILLRRLDENQFVFVLVDSLDDTVFIKVLDYFRYFAKRKILRRRERFEKRIQEEYGV